MRNGPITTTGKDPDDRTIPSRAHPMSGQATGWVLRNGPRDRAMRAVLIVIADAANADGEHSHPGMANVVDGSLYSAGHVQRITTKLVADGWIEVEQEHAPGRATVYRIPGITAHPEARLTPRTMRGDPSSTPRIDDGNTALLDGNTAHSYARTYGLSNVTKQRNDNDTALASLARVDADFDEFYAAYPRKVGKPAARAKYRAARNQTDAGKIRWGLARWRDFWAADKTNVGFIPHPATWLHQERWNDTPPPVAASTPSSNIAKFEAAVAARKSTTTKEITA